MDTPFILGVNYWPRRKAMYWWQHFDAGEVRDEFALIAELGLDLVRIFLLWEDFQPEPDRVSSSALSNLETVADTAADLGLHLDVTFFTGHMSGPNWAPSWMLSPGKPPSPSVRQVISRGVPVAGGYRNMYHDPVSIAAAGLLLSEVVGRLHDHPAIGVWNLGNEPDLFAWPRSVAAAQSWLQRMVHTIRDLDPIHPITCGLHADSLLQDNRLRVPDVFAEVDWAVMHGYPMYAEWAKSPLDPDFVPYLCALTTALSGKPTLMEEFGGCTTAPGHPSATWEWTAFGQPRSQFMASEEALADYIAGVLPRLVDVGATGAVLWCFADYTPDLWDRSPCDEVIHERFFGLVRPDGSLKPHAEVLRDFAATSPRVRPAIHKVKLDISASAYYEDPAYHARRLYASYLNQ